MVDSQLRTRGCCCRVGSEGEADCRRHNLRRPSPLLPLSLLQLLRPARAAPSPRCCCNPCAERSPAFAKPPQSAVRSVDVWLRGCFAWHRPKDLTVLPRAPATAPAWQSTARSGAEPTCAAAASPAGSTMAAAALASALPIESGDTAGAGFIVPFGLAACADRHVAWSTLGNGINGPATLLYTLPAQAQRTATKELLEHGVAVAAVGCSFVMHHAESSRRHAVSAFVCMPWSLLHASPAAHSSAQGM
jgi:hypothetical protein